MYRDRFSGPLFLVGMPRSGTKLIRDLLNRNPRIGIPIIESNFIPYMLNEFGNPPEFSGEHRFQRFYAEFTQTGFYLDFKKRGRVLSRQDLQEAVDGASWASIFEFILKYYAPDIRTENFIWGDKSPHYLNHMPLLKELYPKARFIHIFRDPRDYCLSNKKSWGKSLYRAAEDWRRRLESARADSNKLGSDYMELSYESLLADPREILTSICSFLGCKFISSMMRLSKPTENLGDAKGRAHIISANRRKYLKQLSPFQIRRIEEIVYPVALALGYELENNVQFRPVGPHMLRMLTLYDSWASIKFHAHEYGLRQGINRLYQWHSRASWTASYLKPIRNVADIARR